MQYFVTSQYLTTHGIITSNVDTTDFAPLVQNAAKAFIKKQIGTLFFNDLLTKYNSQTLSSDEEKVVEIMQFAIAWRTSAEAGVTLTYQLKNKGYQTQSDDNSEAVEDKVVWQLYNHYIQKAFVFENELKEWLVANKDLYSVFISTANNDSTIKNNEHDWKGTDYNSGIGLMII